MSTSKESIYILNTGSPEAEHRRLNTQHFVFTDIMRGELLPAHIQVPLLSSPSASPPKILEIATGSAIWLLEMSKLLPADAELVGVDLDTSKFPPAESLPGNISLRTHNMHEPFPDELRGRFDVVNVRLIIFALKEGLGVKLAQNLLTLLKPGGYLVWTETGPLLTSVEPPSINWYQFQDINYRFAKKVGRDLNLPLAMRHYLSLAGFTECDDRAYPGNSQLFNPDNGPHWLERTNALFRSFIAQTLRGIVSLGGVQDGGISMSTDAEAEDLIRRCDAELADDTHKIHYLLIRAWGRKPGAEGHTS
ncbi:hypothetical protein F5Y17DRAFT_427602 [Xylariaceae sp. FL0594]|nr:hypothetical protein F5Y17DRAFT_427602 [Xylariaceae sp. FL0594]